MVTFGANTTATFGRGTPAAGGFNLNSANATFGSVAPPPPPLGAASTLPSTPKAGSSPAPAFGAATAGFGLGAPVPAPAPAPVAGGGGLFGGAGVAAAAPAPAPAATGGFGGFGAASPAAAPAAGGGLFGAPAPAPAAGGFFGGTPAPAPAPGGLFGAPAPAPAVGGFGFGASAPAAPPPVAAAAPPAAPSSATLARRQESARLEAGLLSLLAQYSPRVTDPSHLVGTSPHHAHLPSSQCRFRYVYYDPMTAEQRHARLLHGPHHVPPRPPHVDARTWADAVGRNPDPAELVPVVIVGASELVRRMTDQSTQSQTLGGYCANLRGYLSDLAVQMAQSDDATRAAQKEHAALRSRLLRLMRKLEIVRCTNLPLQVAERDAAERVDAVRRGVDAVGRALADVEERGRHHVHALRSVAAAGGGGGGGGVGGAGGGHGRHGGVGGAGGAGETVSEQGLADLRSLLDQQRVGMDELSAIVHRDLRDAKIAREEVAAAAAAGGGGGGGGGQQQQRLGLGPAPHHHPMAGTYRPY